MVHYAIPRHVTSRESVHVALCVVRGHRGRIEQAHYLMLVNDTNYTNCLPPTLDVKHKKYHMPHTKYDVFGAPFIICMICRHNPSMYEWNLHKCK